jgi:hypothetical protein
MSSQIIPYAKLVSTAAPLILAGYSFSFSQNSVRNLSSSSISVGPATSLFGSIYYSGAYFAAPLGLLTSISSSYLAYTLSGQQRTTWAIAAAAVFSTLPLTRFVMFGGIHRLIEMSTASTGEQEKVQRTGEHTALMKTWVWQNYVRGALFFVSGITALSAITH